MNEIATLLKLLELPDNDYWSDEACNEAREIINSNQESIFPYLLEEWIKLSILSQEHLAYILGENNSKKERELIEKMLNSTNESVSFRAREALNEIDKSA